MKAYQAERKFLYFEKRHFLFLSRMSFLCMRRSDPQERRSRTLKTGIDFKPNSKTFRYILNHNNNKKLRKLCLSRFCVCSAIPTCLLSDINPCRILAWDARFWKLCSKIIFESSTKLKQNSFPWKLWHVCVSDCEYPVTVMGLWDKAGPIIGGRLTSRTIGILIPRNSRSCKKLQI